LRKEKKKLNIIDENLVVGDALAKVFSKTQLYNCLGRIKKNLNDLL
jgi:hypothetical protein